MTDFKIIGLNGPPQAGKDTLARYIESAVSARGLKYARVPMADPLKRGALTMAYPFMSFVGDRERDFFYEQVKDSPIHPDINYSLRDLIIEISESVVKPKLGQGFWIIKALEMLDRKRHVDRVDIVVINDLGFPEEADVLRTVYEDDFTLVRVEQDGKTFDGDSRKPIDAPDWVIYNDASIDALHADAERIIAKLYS